LTSKEREKRTEKSKKEKEEKEKEKKRCLRTTHRGLRVDKVSTLVELEDLYVFDSHLASVRVQRALPDDTRRTVAHSPNRRDVFFTETTRLVAFDHKLRGRLDEQKGASVDKRREHCEQYTETKVGAFDSGIRKQKFVKR